MLDRVGLARRGRLRAAETARVESAATVDYWRSVAQQNTERVSMGEALALAGARGSATDEPPRVVHELISLADRLAGLSQPSDTAVGLVMQRMGVLLAACDVVEIRDLGTVDPARHEVVATVPAPDPASDGRIADTVRPGYLWRNALLRAQQIVAYVDQSERTSR